MDFEDLPRIRTAALLGPILASLAIAACSSAPPATFDLNSVHQFTAVRGGGGQLAIYEPVASVPLDSERIVIRTGPDSVAYLKGAQWAGRLTELVQARLVESFENAHALQAVGRPGLVANFSLESEIRHFEADVTHGQARVEISAKIVTANGRTVTSKVFSSEASVGHDDPSSVTAALDHALSNVLNQIVVWAAPKVARS
jgi:cholesterol transport system auxiliary component